MRLLPLLFPALLAGCLMSTEEPMPQEPVGSGGAMQSTDGGAGDMAGHQQGSGNGNSTDMAHMQPASDGGSTGGTGTKAFGEVCTGNADCASGACFMGGMGSYCSIKCTVATAATDCPVPPTSGVCNNQGYCKK